MRIGRQWYPWRALTKAERRVLNHRRIGFMTVPGGDQARKRKLAADTWHWFKLERRAGR